MLVMPMSVRRARRVLAEGPIRTGRLSKIEAGWVSILSHGVVPVCLGKTLGGASYLRLQLVGHAGARPQGNRGLRMVVSRRRWCVPQPPDKSVSCSGRRLVYR